MICQNNLFLDDDLHHDDKEQAKTQRTHSSKEISFRDILSFDGCSNDNNNNSDKAIAATSPSTPTISSIVFCTYIADWNWLAAELFLCPLVTKETKIYVVINWLPETCNTEDPLPGKDNVFSEGVREVVISKGTLFERTITLVHPALCGGLMHVKLSLIQFSNERSTTRIVIGSANLTLDDWCNLRQGFFIAEGSTHQQQQPPPRRATSEDAAESNISTGDKNTHDEEKSKSKKNLPSSSSFHRLGEEVHNVLLWLSLPKSVVESFQLTSLVFENNVSDNTRLIFSIPSSLQLALTKIQQDRKRKAELVADDSHNNNQRDDENDDSEDGAAEDDDDDGLPPLELQSGIRRKYSKATAHAHDQRKEFYEEYLPIAFDLNSSNFSESPLQTLRNCVAKSSRSTTTTTSSPQNIIYQASSVGGVSDKLIRYFVAATNPSLPFPPDALSSSSSSLPNEHNNTNNNDDKEDTAATSSSSNSTMISIITPFPSRNDVIRNAQEHGWSGAITLRYFQLSSSTLHMTAYRRMSSDASSPACHTKLIFPEDESKWFVLGSHNFTADCWAFGKAFAPRNFELSVFIPPLAEGDRVSDYFPVQCDFDGRDSSVVAEEDQRFVFLNHKRQFFPALQYAEEKLKRRNEKIAKKMMMDSAVVKSLSDKQDKELLMDIFVDGLEYHYGKFKGEVNNDFGRH